MSDDKNEADYDRGLTADRLSAKELRLVYRIIGALHLPDDYDYQDLEVFLSDVYHNIIDTNARIRRARNALDNLGEG